MSLFLKSPIEIALLLAQRAKAKRLFLNFSQKTLSLRSGVSYGVIKRFEQTGKISLESLLKISLVLGLLEEFDNLFNKEKTPETLKDLLKQQVERKRGRK